MPLPRFHHPKATDFISKRSKFRFKSAVLFRSPFYQYTIFHWRLVSFFMAIWWCLARMNVLKYVDLKTVGLFQTSVKIHSSHLTKCSIKALCMLHCKAVFVLTILTFCKVYAIIHYGVEDGGILLRLPSHLWKTLTVLSYKNALLYLSVSGDS